MKKIIKISLFLLLSLNLVACSSLVEKISTIKEASISIAVKGENKQNEIEQNVQYIGNARVEGNLLGIGTDIADERYKAVIEKEMGFDNPAPQNSIWTEYYSPTLNQTLLINTNKVEGARNIYNLQGENIVFIYADMKDEPVEKTLQHMVLGWDIADAIDKRYGGK